MRGLKVLKIPPRYLSEDASPEEKQTREVFEKILATLHIGEQSGIMIPMAYDENSKPLFDFEVKSVLGQSAHNVNEVITRYKKEIVVGLMAPHLTLGQDGSGSFALADALNAVSNVVIEARLKEIKDQLNHDLIPQLFAINGWDTTVTPYFDYIEDRDSSLDDISKYIQRIAAVGGIKFDAAATNWVHERVGLPRAYEDTDMDMDDVIAQNTGVTTGAGEGMESGMPSGTSDDVDSDDNSISNLEN